MAAGVVSTAEVVSTAAGVVSTAAVASPTAAARWATPTATVDITAAGTMAAIMADGTAATMADTTAATGDIRATDGAGADGALDSALTGDGLRTPMPMVTLRV